MTMRKSALGNVYQLAWKHESARVRRAALYLLCKGRVSVEHITSDDSIAINALRDAGCDFTVEYSGICTTFVFTCEGTKECYANGAFCEQE